MKLMTSGQVRDTLGIELHTLHKWTVAGFITPVAGGEGQGSHRVFALTDVLAIGVGRALRSKGLSLEVAAAVMKVVRAHSEERLLAAFKAGRNCVVFVGNNVLPKLSSEHDARDAAVPFAEAFEATGVFPMAINIEATYRNILRAIEAREKESKATV